MNGLTVPSPWFTGKSLSEALIFESTNPQYDNRLFIALQVRHENSKLKTWGEHGSECQIINKLCTQHVLLMFSLCSKLGTFMY